MKHQIFLMASILGSIGLATPLLTSCSNSGTVTSELTPVHKWINERTFTIGDYIYQQSYEFGTCWLFYHNTSASDNYTYYALTNFHVGMDLHNSIASGKSGQIFYGYQTEDQIEGDTNRINYYSGIYVNSGAPNHLNELCTFGSGSCGSEFSDLYTEYLQVDTKHVFIDMNVIQLDFTNDANKNETLKTRLDNLNNYATSRGDNYVVPLASNSEYTTINNTIDSSNVSMYAGGYPIETLGEKDIYSDNSYKFQYQKFNLLIRDTNEDYISHPWNQTTYYPLNGSTAWTNSTYLTYGNDYYSGQNNNRIAFGGGASGSLGVYASDENDASTYRAIGIYWGTSSYGNIYDLHFSPFWINWGNAINGYYNATNKTFIDRFMDNRSNCPMDHQMDGTNF